MVNKPKVWARATAVLGIAGLLLGTVPASADSATGANLAAEPQVVTTMVASQVIPTVIDPYPYPYPYPLPYPYPSPWPSPWPYPPVPTFPVEDVALVAYDMVHQDPGMPVPDGIGDSKLKDKTSKISA